MNKYISLFFNRYEFIENSHLKLTPHLPKDPCFIAGGFGVISMEDWRTIRNLKKRNPNMESEKMGTSHNLGHKKLIENIH